MDSLRRMLQAKLQDIDAGGDPLAPLPNVDLEARASSGLLPIDSADVSTPPPAQFRDRELEQAQRQDVAFDGGGRVTDALHSAFSRTPLQFRPRREGMTEDLITRRAAEKTQQDQALDDPASEVSTRARTVFASTPTGKAIVAQMGPSYGRLSARQLPGGKDLLAAIERRSAADAASAARKAEREQRLADEAVRDGRRHGHRLEEIEAAKKATAKGRAAGGAGGSTYKDLEKDTQKLGDDVEDLPALRNDLQVLVQAAGQDDVPGVGPWDSIKPDKFDSATDTATRQAIRRTIARIIKRDSGATATEEEVARKEESLGMGRGATEAQFRTGLASLAKEARDIYGSKEAKYRPDVRKNFSDRGGASAATLPSYDPAAPKARTNGTSGNWNVGEVVMVAPDGKRYALDESEVADAERNGWKRGR